MRSFLRILIISSFTLLDATSNFTVGPSVDNFWRCDGGVAGSRSVQNADPARNGFIQIGKASCVYSMTEGLPVCIATGLDGSVWEHIQGHWYRAFTPDIPIDLSFSCLLMPQYVITCFTRGSDGAIWWTTRQEMRNWTALQSMGKWTQGQYVGGVSDQVPSCVITDTNKGVCFYKGLDGFAYYSSTSQVVWYQIKDTVLSSKIRCFNDVLDTVSCVSLNAASEVVVLTWNDVITSSWQLIGPERGQLFGSPACVSEDLSDRVQCLGRRFDNQLVFARRQDGVWSGWMSIEDESIFSEAECVHVSFARSACYYISDRMRLKSRVFWEGQWYESRTFNLLYLEEPACTGVEPRAAMCMARAVPDISKVICQLIGK